MNKFSTQLIVIGGGATGLGIAWDAALRGIKVVLVEKSDLATGTSGRYHGLLHSGGRYVISDPQAAIDCARENEVLRRIAPETIEDTGGFFISTPVDPIDYPETWRKACERLALPFTELNLSSLREKEPLLNPRISRAFEVRDASLDSFDLSHALCKSIIEAGGKVLLHHELVDFLFDSDRIIGVEVLDLREDRSFQIEAEVTVNATGPWAAETAQLAGLKVPITLGKGTMLAMASRMVNTVINRLKPPSDGDIAVPIGTVCVLGTTDVPVESPNALGIEPWEIDLLIAEGDYMIPGFQSARALRAWSGIRPLYSPEHDSNTRSVSRGHALLDHKQIDDIDGLLSIIGGKLTTFRSMAEDTVDAVCDKLEIISDCQTTTTPLLTSAERKMFTLPERLVRYSDGFNQNVNQLVCECELVTKDQLASAIESSEFETLDDLRRDLRLGMGPCQAAFCAYRTLGLTAHIKPDAIDPNFLGDFLNERWKGLRPIAWGRELCQMDFLRRVYLELLGEQHPEVKLD